MSIGRIFARIGITLFFAVTGASLGAYIQTQRFAGKPQEFRSLAKLVVGSKEASPADLYGTIIERIGSAEMKWRALERVRQLHPELRDIDVGIRVAQTKGSAIINILATGSEPKYTRIFLDALLDEVIALPQSIPEQKAGGVFQSFINTVVSRQDEMEATMAAMERLNAIVGTVSARSDQERLTTRLNALRNQRDDLQIQLKPLNAGDVARDALEARLNAIKHEIQDCEAQLLLYEPALSRIRRLAEKHAAEKLAYEKLFEQLQQVWEAFAAIDTPYLAIEGRATPAAENMEDATFPILIGAVCSGVLGLALGLLLSFFLVRSAQVPQSAAHPDRLP